jgi:hypothetical protein
MRSSASAASGAAAAIRAAATTGQVIGKEDKAESIRVLEILGLEVTNAVVKSAENPQ